MSWRKRKRKYRRVTRDPESHLLILQGKLEAERGSYRNPDFHSEEKQLWEGWETVRQGGRDLLGTLQLHLAAAYCIHVQGCSSLPAEMLEFLYP